MLKDVRKALFALSDKSGGEVFARFLTDRGVEIFATDGTARYLKEKGISVSKLSSLTGFSERCGGRVKTLNEEIFSRILCRPEDDEYSEKFDLVFVDLYPFERNKSIENIDIGGVSLIRAAAKNYENVIVVSDREDSLFVMKLLKEKGDVPLKERKHLAFKAFRRTMLYDFEISLWLGLNESEVKVLRYGENPHQKAFFYPLSGSDGTFDFYGDKSPSFNNIYDAYRAWLLVKEFEKPACAIIKHSSPCGVAMADNSEIAFRKALECDPLSAYGGVVALNVLPEEKVLREIERKFFDLIVLPEPPAFDFKRRYIVPKFWSSKWDIRSAFSGLLVQEPDNQFAIKSDLEEDVIFSFKVVKHLYSNAICVVKDKATVGLCGGQPSRIFAVKIALSRAGERAKGSVLASDGFFPFPDSIEEAYKYGVRVIIAPMGSKRDEEVMKRARELGIKLILVEERHFRH
ncbi:MAG: bifunctional phosphoribosylaminoimidazolecarboxamide formyltransferase/IMP cyclohydrolase [Synergistetes bacterium]|nr:bifunctional phosphoribosylaminoimidazolecarboxamide formyltransferase/IMP cyclohydrolase [Synergistota bacterium]